jgi:hypothetical protein
MIITSPKKGSRSCSRSLDFAAQDFVFPRCCLSLFLLVRKALTVSCGFFACEEDLSHQPPDDRLSSCSRSLRRNSKAPLYVLVDRHTLHWHGSDGRRAGRFIMLFREAG